MNSNVNWRTGFLNWCIANVFEFVCFACFACLCNSRRAIAGFIISIYYHWAHIKTLVLGYTEYALDQV